jgi:hypothetical protein
MDFSTGSLPAHQKKCSGEIIVFDTLLGHASIPPPLWHPDNAIMMDEVNNPKGGQGVVITNFTGTP